MKYKIQDAVDALGKPISIWHTDSLGQEKAVCAMYLRGLTFLLERNWCNAPLEMASNNHKAIWVENESGIPMGGIVYEYIYHNKQGWINFVFTDEKFRGRHGVYGILQKALETEIIKLGGTSIASMTHKDNRSRIKSGAREGMEPQFIRLYKDLTPDLENVKQKLSDETRKPWSAITKEKWNGNQ